MYDRSTVAFAVNMLTVTLSGLPATVDPAAASMIDAADKGVLVSVNVAAASPFATAETEYCPATVLAANTGAVATPLLPLATDALTPPPANVPLAPLVGALKTTVVPGTALPNPSLTFADSAVANAASSSAVCPDPALAPTVAAAAGDSLTVCVACNAEFTVSAAVIVCEPLV